MKISLHATGLIALLINLNALFSIVNGQSDIKMGNENEFNSNTNTYWPPAYNSETIELEKFLMEKLDLGCLTSQPNINFNNITNNSNKTINNSDDITITSATRTTSPSSTLAYFMISETENRETLNDPNPNKFVHIPSGTPLELIFECDECPNNQIIYNDISYDTTKFDCKTLCIFTAVKTHTDICRKGQMYKIGLKLGDKFIKLLETCHHLEVPSNITYDAETLIWKLGKYSRTIQNEKNLCQPKCMPVCRGLNETLTYLDGIMENEFNNETISSNDSYNENFTMEFMNEIISNENYTMEFMENLCVAAAANRNNIVKYSRNIEKNVCEEKTNNGSILRGNYFMGLYILIIKIVLDIVINK